MLYIPYLINRNEKSVTHTLVTSPRKYTRHIDMRDVRVNPLTYDLRLVRSSTTGYTRSCRLSA